jgi:hypothetical protein
MRLCDFRKFSIMFVLAVALSLAVAASPKEAFVKDVAFSASGHSLEAKITTSESAKFTYFELDGPHRLVVDFHGRAFERATSLRPTVRPRELCSTSTRR